MPSVTKSVAVKVLIVDDHPVFRDGLRRALQDDAEFFVLGEASNGEDATRLASEIQADVILLDFALPDFSGLEVLRRLREGKLKTHVVLITAAIERQQIMEALQLGARGVVMKDAGMDVIKKCIHAILAGEYWIGREVMADWVQYLKNDVPRATVTSREREIIDRVLKGLTNRDIGRVLGISEQTVKRHISNIYDKLGVSNRMELALYITSGKLHQDL